MCILSISTTTPLSIDAASTIEQLSYHCQANCKNFSWLCQLEFLGRVDYGGWNRGELQPFLLAFFFSLFFFLWGVISDKEISFRLIAVECDSANAIAWQ